MTIVEALKSRFPNDVRVTFKRGDVERHLIYWFGKYADGLPDEPDGFCVFVPTNGPTLYRGTSESEAVAALMWGSPNENQHP